MMSWLKELQFKGKYVAMGNVIINNSVSKMNHPIVNIIGLIVLLIIILFVFIVPCPSRSQYTFLRIGFSLCVSTMVIPLFGKARIGRHNVKGLLTLIMIFSTYFANPATLIRSDKCPSFSQVKGNVLIGSKPLEDALILLPQNDFKTFSNSLGDFVIQWQATDLESDSILIQIQSKGIDTSFYWNKRQGELKVILSNPIIPISKKIVSDLIDYRIHDFVQMMNGNYLKWKLDSTIHIKELIKKYEPFETKMANYRNEFLFQGLKQKKNFRKNLRDAGVSEVETLPPYEKHYFDSCSIFLLKTKNFPNYKLDYLMQNKKPIEYESRLQYITDDQYKVTISFEENIRDIRVLLTCSKETNGYKVRQMEVYGFLPVEEYVLEFRHGKWVLIELENG